MWLVLSMLLGGSAGWGDEPLYRRFREAPHGYFEREPTDRFTRLKAELEAGTLAWDTAGGEKAFLRALLARLGVPASSQMLVFSTTSLQLSRIQPTNPRALYFSDDIYVGYIPGGRLELAALDAELGVVFHIFDVPGGGGEPVRVERATRCMNCHAGDDTGHVPGLVVKSVVPGPSGGSLDAFRLGVSGHGVPWEDRFGGWYLTGVGSWTNHWGNTIGRMAEGVMARLATPPEERVPWGRYLAGTSGLLAQALHEHQVGFVNRAVGAAYRARAFLHEAGGEERLTEAHQRELDVQAEELVRYMVFADEVPWPAGRVVVDEAFREEFLAVRRVVDGHSLRDLDLGTRLMANRCSYMIYTPVFAGLPPVVKDRVFRRLDAVLADGSGGVLEGAARMTEAERGRIRRVLSGTLEGLPAGWGGK